MNGSTAAGGYLPNLMEPRQWPADLPDRASVDCVFQAYGSGSHVAVVRRTPRVQAPDIWVECRTCGFSTAKERVDYDTPVGRDRFLPALDEARGLASRHVEETLTR